MKQLIQIGIPTSSASESLRILKVYLERRDPENPVLVVVSKKSDPPSCLDVVISGRFEAKLEVEVPGDKELPVMHYVLGLSKRCRTTSDDSVSSENAPTQEAESKVSKAPIDLFELEQPSSSEYEYKNLNVPFRRLQSQKDLVLSESAYILYENPDSEEEEEEAEEYEEDLKEEKKLIEEYKNKKAANDAAKVLETEHTPSNYSKTTNTIKTPLIRSDSPKLADANACVGSNYRGDWEHPELPLYVRALAFVAVGIFGIAFFQIL